MLSMALDKDLLAKQITVKHIGLLEALISHFKSCKPPLGAFLILAQRIMPRYYTIASSNKAWPDKIRIAISLTIDKVGDCEVHGFNS
jgi:sulfite reductase alpha subunit-like flavoprotein